MSRSKAARAVSRASAADSRYSRSGKGASLSRAAAMAPSRPSSRRTSPLVLRTRSVNRFCMAIKWADSDEAAKKAGDNGPGLIEQKNGLPLVADMDVHRVPTFERHQIEAQHVQDFLGRRAAELGEHLGFRRPGPGQCVDGGARPAHPGHLGAVGQGHGHPGLGGAVADDVVRRGGFGSGSARPRPRRTCPCCWARSARTDPAASRAPWRHGP